MRIFIALPLTDEDRRGVKKVVKYLERGRWAVAWEPEEKWHLTLAFLGEVSDIEPVLAAVASACKNMSPFTLKFKGLGAFPDLLLPKVVWLGLKGDLKSLYKLVKNLRGELDGAGIDFDHKVFRPHITLGRIKTSMSRKQRLELGKIISKNRILDIPQTWLVDKVVVYESRLTPSGSDYRICQEYGFGNCC